MSLKKIVTIVLLILTFGIVQSQQCNPSILVFSKTEAFRHKSIPTGIKFLSELANKNKWKIKFSEDSNDFYKENLNQYNVLVFLNTSGDIFDKKQKEALQDYMANGNGFIGIHAASDTEKEWPWFTEMIGATFKSHPKVQNATLIIDKSNSHPAINHLNEKEVFKDEWYNFLNPVAKHVNVLASLDESSYQGKKMNTNNHPITWYHYYDGGRVFYTGLGHTKEVYSDSRFKKMIYGAILWASNIENVKAPSSKKWTNLFDGKLYKNWDVFMGVPHASVLELDNVDKNSDGINGIPLGLNIDPKKVFTYKKEKGENQLHISGEIYGALTSKQEYQNYHLKLQFKWGDKVWEPRLLKKRDSGILYHCQGSYTSFWNVWMASQEFQVQEGDVGDYYGLVNVLIDIPSEKQSGDKEFRYVNDGDLHPYSSLQHLPPNHCNKGFNNEKPHGEWNTLELICFEDTSLHIVNGKVVMALYNSMHENSNKEIVPLTKGRIQIQSEGAEIYYKNIQIQTINDIPRKYKKKLNKY
ncbi:ThuA domain-containing protein [Algibacter sp. PT7-4]|uniref:ThuA domain-containing protein n=1 Tax=Algibacter ulvanivorans TaxID=3400999 RepID=UPI003AAE55B4